MRWLMYLLIAILLTAVGFVSGYFWPHNAASVSPAQGCFEVSDVKFQRALHSGLSSCDIFPCIVGNVRNTCAQRFDAIWLTYNLYDTSGVQVGSTDGMVQNLEPHSTARFWAQLDDTPKAPKFKLTKIAVAPTQ
jgi:hypothetical protein